jgi:hypothetical protein
VIAVLREKPHKALVDHRRRKDLDIGECSDARDKPIGMLAASVDEVADAGAAEGAERRVGRKSATTA